MTKPVKSKSYKRGKPHQKSYDSVLVVCEGSKSEPNYLKALRSHYQLSSVKVIPSWGSDPMSVVDSAEKECEKSQYNYDYVYCVFDRDEHPKSNYHGAIDKINTLKKTRPGKWNEITSLPCFEVWVLLHFTDATAPFSVCEKVIQKIKKNHIPKYDKGSLTLYELLEPHTDTAITHGKRLEKHNNENGSKNPSTQFHLLVDYLRELKS